ncbi:flagellar hook-associated protein FlgK [Pseudomonas daroniae]|uniref:Flagellar hook-associated protein 1 n=1 Tax=Phytopseudomonas daroniae TaxID=2487519 RepID=A0A4Q9QSG8_9GAMM|nr:MULTISPECIES: flagellar hook-associated protein FlgK [Pseudomonas]TBU77085.1 flagellar hook-associated protein FlgK [Pseudomonas daroniae]TBU83381.1 flagellar hook-associated protein FlgK [Pseudomonas daroniae]TBU85020.1 flagellar hook-associated protein FlgK [Pseudomonas sp. FRB 228]TBU93687.1 flagellar hook-associated protein FlgK [Pseudomonas daroniae]
MSNLMSIGLSGVRASQTSLNVTGNNITNVDTAGYSRQATTQVSAASQQSGNLYIGSGTTIEDVRRIYSSYLTTQVRTATGLDSAAQTFNTQIQQTNALLADSTTGISSVLQSFFAAMQTASSNPTDTASRQLLLTQASGLTERFNSVYNQLADQNAYLNQQMSTMTGQVNKLASNVASYNLAITQASASGASPNDLLDARDEAVRQLSELIGVTVLEQDGNYNLFIGSGQPLVVGATASTLSASPSASDPSRFSVYLSQGSSTQDISSVISTGSIGGLLTYRSQVLDSTMNELGRVALVLADQVNSQLGQGLDLNGEFGAALFSNINSATAIAQRSLANAGNTVGSGNLNVTISDTGQLTTSNYEVTMGDNGDYSVRRLSDGVELGSGNLSDDPPSEFDGFSISLPGGSTVASGDRFTLIPTRSAASTIGTSMTDASKLALAAPLSANLTTGNLGTGAITQPTLTTRLDIHDATANAATQAAIQEGTPLKVVFGTSSNGSQSYSVYDSSGTAVASGSIVPGNSNSLEISIPDGAGGEAFSFSMDVSGSPASGDSFTVSFNSDGVSDNRNAQSLLDLQTKSTVGLQSGSGASISGAYGSLIEQVGARTNQAELDAKATGSILSGATASRESLSGVNLDEEAVNLVKFQQYYSASAKVIAVASEIFDTLINTFR